MARRADSSYRNEPKAGSTRLEEESERPASGGVEPRILAARVLSVVAAALVFALIAGTIIGFATGSRQRKLDREALAPGLAGSGQAVFSGIGTLRASTRDKAPAIVIATIAFPYDGSDRPFKEELIRKAPALKAAAIAFFSRKKAEELAPVYEGTVKAALRDTLNGLLSLGKVQEIWLSDFTVVQ